MTILFVSSIPVRGSTGNARPQVSKKPRYPAISLIVPSTTTITTTATTTSSDTTQCSASSRLKNVNGIPTIDISSWEPHFYHANSNPSLPKRRRPPSPSSHRNVYSAKTTTTTTTRKTQKIQHSLNNVTKKSSPPSPRRHSLQQTTRTQQQKQQHQRPVPTTTTTTTNPPSSLTSPARRRKPHGYWNELENVEKELVLVNVQLGYSGRRLIPRIIDMQKLGRGDLIAALMKHGGVRRVSKALRWTCASSSSSESLTTSNNNNNNNDNNSSVIQSVRDKLPRRPIAYWQNVERVHFEMSAFIDEFGTRGKMPTRKQLYTFGRSDLANAAMRHGGLRKIAKQMGLDGTKEIKPKGYWTDLKTLRKELRKLSINGMMPTADELASCGKSCLVNAIATHGGFPVVAKKCGLTPRNVKRQGAPKLWDEQRLRREYLSFLITFYPESAKQGIMIGERQLRKHGRNDLSYAIAKMGGFGKLSQKLGLKKKVFKRIEVSSENENGT